MASLFSTNEKASVSSGEEMELDSQLKRMEEFYPPEIDEMEEYEEEPYVYNGKSYKLKKHPLMFASVAHLTCFRLDNFPLYCHNCKKNKGKLKHFNRSVESNGRVARLTCECTKLGMVVFKAFLIDLYNHKRLYISKNDDPSKNDGKNHYFLHFTKDGENFESFQFEYSSFSSDINNPLYIKPLIMNLSYIQQKKGYTISRMREKFFSQYDYMKPEEENNESILSLFYDITETDLPNTSHSKNAAAEKSSSQPRKKQKKSLEDFLERNKATEDERPEPLTSFDVNDINKILKDYHDTKVELANLQFRIYEQSLIFESLKSSNDSRIDKMTNLLNSIDLELKKIKQKKPTYASVAAKGNKNSKSNAIVEHKRKLDSIKAMNNERINKKLKTFEENVNTSKDSLPEGVKTVLDSENGMEKIKNAMMSLTTKPEKELKVDQLTRVYVEGIQRQKIGQLRATLKGIGIINKMLSNISFLKKATCEIVVYKSYKDEFLKLFKAFPETFEILENFDPIKCLEENPTLQDINKTEKAFYNRVHGIISRKLAPEFVKDFFLKVLNETDFKTINGINGNDLPSYEEKLQQNENSEMDIDHEKDNEEDNEEDIEDYIENDDFILPEDPAQEISTSGNHPGESTTKNNKVNNLDNYFVKEKNPIKDKASTSTIANEQENVEILVPCTIPQPSDNDPLIPEIPATYSTIVPATLPQDCATPDNCATPNNMPNHYSPDNSGVKILVPSTFPVRERTLPEIQATPSTIVPATLPHECATPNNYATTLKDARMTEAEKEKTTQEKIKSKKRELQKRAGSDKVGKKQNEVNSNKKKMKKLTKIYDNDNCSSPEPSRIRSSRDFNDSISEITSSGLDSDFPNDFELLSSPLLLDRNPISDAPEDITNLD